MLRKRSTPCAKLSSTNPSDKHPHHHSSSSIQPSGTKPSSSIHLLVRRRILGTLILMLSLYLLIWIVSNGHNFPYVYLANVYNSGIYSVARSNLEPDAIVVGSGLAGLTAALTILDRGGRVLLIEKEHSLGGNSKKASSGINACCGLRNEEPAQQQQQQHDSLDLFTQDTTISAGNAAQPTLIRTLVQHSQNVLEWLQMRLDLPLPVVAQLGGHSVPRTHRPVDGMIGSELILRLSQRLLQDEDRCTIWTDTTVTKVLRDENGRVTGVECQAIADRTSSSTKSVVRAPQVILATGGFAADRTEDSWLSQVRPELRHFGTTAGAFSTGDGLGLVPDAAVVDLDKIQLHPTGFVDPADPTRGTKFLAAEVLRGVGGILVNSDGRRFANELDLRSKVTDKMLQHDPGYLATGEWYVDTPPPTFGLILSEEAARKAEKHVKFYVSKGLLQKLNGLESVAKYLQTSEEVLKETIRDYRDYGQQGNDPFGKRVFPDLFDGDDDDSVFYVGHVTPVLHYCMGGIRIDTKGHVLDQHGLPIGGLYAAGEVAGGIHGNNRLGGNSLLDCAVFGRIVGQQIPIQNPTEVNINQKPIHDQETMKKLVTSVARKISANELRTHEGETNPCWVALRDRVYDLTNFSSEHAGGRDPIHLFCGKDATETFNMIHSSFVMEKLGALPVVGRFVTIQE